VGHLIDGGYEFRQGDLALAVGFGTVCFHAIPFSSPCATPRSVWW
jgi:hypothetical protein